MLTEKEKDYMRRCLDAVRRGMPGFQSRQPQLRMMAAVAHTLAAIGKPDARQQGAHLAVIEAGTGTGKTLGYLLPALVLARLRGKHLVVASSTVALQEQLLHKDIPALRQCLPFEVRCTMAKGRARYVCPMRLEMRGGAEFAQDPDAEAQDGAPGDRHRSVRLIGRLADAFAKGNWSGDRDAWPDAIAEADWQAVSCDRQGCIGGQCPRIKRCPFYLARQEIQEASLIVANHDLLLAAADMEPGSVLPDLADTMAVLDEAHGLPAKVIGHCASRHSLRGARVWIEQAAALTREAATALRLGRNPGKSAAAAARALTGRLDTLYAAIGEHCRFEGEGDVWRCPHGALPDRWREIGAELAQAAAEMTKALQAMREAMVAAAADRPAQAQARLSGLGFYLGKLTHIEQTWAWMLRDDASQTLPTARWIERRATAAHGQDYLVCATPISGAQKLRELLWARVGAAVLTSATLRACGQFEPFLEESGLLAYPELRRLDVPSPFDYACRALLRIPRLRAHPRNVEVHTQEILGNLPVLLQNEPGALVLFASDRQMREVYAGLPEGFRDRVLMQGQVSRRELIACHKQRVDRGEPSVLFGLASLAEGVDLPGAYCTHVVIAKLSFAVPGTPMELARREWVERQGRSAFMALSVPEAGIRLAQAAGRLLRTPEDSGTVTVLDPRLGNTHWGKLLLRGLPPFRIAIGDGALV
ncbi:MAG: ATP-dependent DNA helicase DinG [Desulfovibrionaceae bacterium]|nr:ATP-dependent DNA helicase DinG [Desulfovibrionaceae bacterium]